MTRPLWHSLSRQSRARSRGFSCVSVQDSLCPTDSHSLCPAPVPYRTRRIPLESTQIRSLRGWLQAVATVIIC